MPTDKQREAARINGSKSNGPITPEGKRNSTRNNLGRGLFARAVLLEGENAKRFNHLVKALHDDLLPETPIERLFIEKMAAAQWRQMRVWTMESALTAHDAGTSAIEDRAARDGAILRDSNGRLSEYESRCDRLFLRSLERFQTFRRDRRTRPD